MNAHRTVLLRVALVLVALGALGYQVGLARFLAGIVTDKTVSSKTVEQIAPGEDNTASKGSP